MEEPLVQRGADGVGEQNPGRSLGFLLARSLGWVLSVHVERVTYVTRLSAVDGGWWLLGYELWDALVVMAEEKEPARLPSEQQ